MAKVRPKDGLALPAAANPAAEDAVRRDWIEANIAGGGGSPEVIRDSAAPATPHSYKVWIDTSTTPPTVKEWTGTAWQAVQANPSTHTHDPASPTAAGFMSTAYQEFAGGKVFRGTLFNQGRRATTPAAVQTLTASATISPDRQTRPVDSASAITLASTPHIAAGLDGEQFVIFNVGSYPITLQDRDTLVGSGVELGPGIASVTIEPGQMLALAYLASTGLWYTYLAHPFAHNHDALYAAIAHVGSRDGHPLATTTQDGFESAADKAKLEGLSAQAIGAFSAYKSVDQPDILNVTYTKVTFDTEEWDVSGYYDSAASRYTPTKAGLYRFNACVTISPSVDQKLFSALLYKNGALHKYVVQLHTSGTNALIASGMVDAEANGSSDYFEVYVRHNFGVDTSDLLASQSFCFFQGHYLGSKT